MANPYRYIVNRMAALAISFMLRMAPIEAHVARVVSYTCRDLPGAVFTRFTALLAEWRSQGDSRTSGKRSDLIASSNHFVMAQKQRSLEDVGWQAA